MATPASTPRPLHHASKPTPRSNTTASAAANSVHTPTPASLTSPPTPAAVRAAASPMYLREKLAKSSPLAPGGFSMSRVPTGASEAATQISIGSMDGAAEKTELTPAVMGLGDLGIVGAAQVGVNGLGAGLGIRGMRDQEEERSRKTETIISMLATKWGRSCPEGIERAAKRVGLECLWEEGRGGAKSTLSIAGNGVLVELAFDRDEVQDVTLEFTASGQEVGKGAPEGAEVLKKDLNGQEKDGYVFLDAFVRDLEVLARMDKLAEGGISCFDAVDGIRAALERIFEWDFNKKRDVSGPDFDKEMLDRDILCRGNGRPKMHTRGRLGLAVQFWMDRSLLPPEIREPEAMDIDQSIPKLEENLDIYSAIIECEASASSLYPSIRVSESWVSDSVESHTLNESNPLTMQQSQIDWQEPPPTLVTASQLLGDNAMALTSQDPLLQERPPNVRFIAHFEPPIVMPLQVAIDIHQFVGAPLAQEALQSTTYESLIFADTPLPSNLHEQRIVTKTVSSYNSFDEPTKHKHQYTLFLTQPEYGRLIDSLPFSHPRQIVELLPILRQWILLGSLLRRSFVPDPVPASSVGKINGQHDGDFDFEAQPNESMTVEEELAAFLAPDPLRAPEPEAIEEKNEELLIDVTLSTSPSPPRIGVVWPQGSGLKTVDFSVGLNGAVEIHGEEEEKELEKEKIKKVLEIGEDVGVLVEWLSKEP
ncbi:MAG: hypothetical protein Q9191_003883 [Dirinaria sp. TL-2023a]